MSLFLTLYCDGSGPTGLCGAIHSTSTADETDARSAAAQAGWDTGGDGCDLCPRCRTTPAS
ncbi:hypothetical protein [[Kitasatospora] papulosa]|uniref:hypothetical protein n=1 Tax=[Kitasatospora] papulosa TaxID=1464011 RepID=UPI0036763A4F